MEHRDNLLIELDEIRKMCADRNQIYDSAQRLSLEAQHLRKENAELRDRELANKSVSMNVVGFPIIHPPICLLYHFL